MPERFVNKVPYFLQVACLATDTTLTLQSVSGLPTDGTFRFKMGGEILLVDGTQTNVGASTIKVTRGTESTIAAPQGIGTQLMPILTAAGMAQAQNDVGALTTQTITAGTYTALVGYLYVCDTTAGPIVLNVPVLAPGQALGFKHAKGSLAANTITVNATSPQTLEQPPPSNASAPSASVVVGGASQGGAENNGTSLTWKNLGVTNVLNLA